jgi:hypothetical protein
MDSFVHFCAARLYKNKIAFEVFCSLLQIQHLTQRKQQNKVQDLNFGGSMLSIVISELQHFAPVDKKVGF